MTITIIVKKFVHVLKILFTLLNSSIMINGILVIKLVFIKRFKPILCPWKKPEQLGKGSLSSYTENLVEFPLRVHKNQ